MHSLCNIFMPKYNLKNQMIAMYVKFSFFCIVVEEQEAMLEEQKPAAMTPVVGRKTPKCKNCGNPRKGHPKNSCP